MRALPTPSANDRPKFHTNMPISELIERDTRAVEASVVSSAPPVAESEDGVMRETRPTPIRPQGARAARSKIEGPRFKSYLAKGPRPPPHVKQKPGEKTQMSLSSLCPTRIEADRVISTFSFDLYYDRTTQFIQDHVLLSPLTR